MEKMGISEAIRRVKEKYPQFSISGLAPDKVRGLADGTLTPVEIKGSNRYEIWVTEDIKSGKLAELNNKIKIQNRQVRMETKAFRNEAATLIENGDDQGLARLIDSRILKQR